MKGEWKTIHNEKLYDLYSSSYIIGAIKYRRIRSAGHVAHRGERRTGRFVTVQII